MSSWLNIQSRGSGLALTETERLDEIVDSLPAPKTQYPSIAVFLGKQAKSKALKALFPRNNTQRRCEPSLIKLHLATDSDDKPNPIFFADVTPDACPSKYSSQGKAWQRFLDVRLDCNEFQLKRKVICCLVAPFAHVFCIFLDDLGGAADTRRFLWSWISEEKGRTGNRKPSLRLLILITDPKNTTDIDHIIDPILWDAILDSIATGIYTVDLRSRAGLSNDTAYYEPLRGFISRHLELGVSFHENEYELFCAAHVRALFRKAAMEFCCNARSVFQPLLASREKNPVPEGAQEHLKNILNASCEMPHQTAIALIGSAFILNAYPPNMHRRLLSN